MQKSLFQVLLACTLTLACFSNLHAQFFNPICSIFSISQTNGEVGDTACVDVRVNAPTGLISIQFALQWDTADLTFLSVNSAPPVLPDLNAGNFSTVFFSASGRLKFSWFDQNVEGVFVQPNARLFKVCFLVKPGATGFLPVQFAVPPFPVDQDFPYEGLGAPDVILPQNLVFGGVQVGSDSPAAPMVQMICSEPGHCQGDTAVSSVDLIVNGIGDTLTYQWSGPNGFSSTSQDLINVPAGNYVVTITNAAGWTTVAVAEVLTTSDPACTTGTQTPNAASDGLSVFPNPASDWVSVSSEDADLQRIMLLSITGQVLLDRPVNAIRQTKLEMPHGAPGLYYLSVLTSKGLRQTRLIME